ncbi:hypothetical protein KY46_21385 [Photobacterium halotolerans]|uniref:Uncharacterized protein n=2 Tax=Photobacterium halotolerans TaxID=265726 RepID=A0A0F5V6S9_9GAMM|nr:hypothetical protein KY46_21385 [Photobacterium halotolerans]
MIGVLASLSFTVQAGWFESKEVNYLKQARLQLCADHTVEDMATSFLSDPEWEYGESEDGERFINLEGGLTFHDKPATALMQFMINPDTSVEFNALEFNGIPQSLMIASALLEKMCSSARENASYTSQPQDTASIERTLATVYGLDTFGEEGLLIRTDQGEFRMNLAAMTEPELNILKLAAFSASSLCFIGQNAIYKDSVEQSC